MKWTILNNGSFNLTWGDATLKGAFPVFDYDCVHPISVNVLEGVLRESENGESDGVVSEISTGDSKRISIEYCLGNNQKIVLKFGAARIYGAERMFK